MVETPGGSEKNSDAFSGWLPVVAGALVQPGGVWLMHQRPAGKMYEGLWEFPGGKVEAVEKPMQTLVRELAEELDVAVDPAACRPALFAQQAGHAGSAEIVLMLYIVTRWEGTPQALEGGNVGWFTPADALALAMPPMDRDLAGRLWRG
jgi:8-oxo-dGTP diphosphatase